MHATLDLIATKSNAHVEAQPVSIQPECIECSPSASSDEQSSSNVPSIGTNALGPLRERLVAQLDPARDDYAVRLVERLLAVAIELHASDVHLDALPDGHFVRYRVDGRLIPIGAIPRGHHTSLAARMKSLAGLLTYRADIPQEGRLVFGSPEREARVVTFPTLYGERVVLRLVATTTKAWRLQDLGLSEDQLREHLQAVGQTSGVILISGTVGTGKTTTAYAMLRTLVQEFQRAVVTLEDPIECQVEGVAQATIDPAVGFDWSSGLRSLLRQDPEVIFIGEIRDALTAQLAFRASMTGQLVITTMHARNPQEALARLVDMQVPALHLISGLRLLTCQQLVAVPCNCQSDSQGNRDGNCEGGCQACAYTGVIGRRLAVEILPPLEGELARQIL